MSEKEPRLYTIPLRRVWDAQKWKRSHKALRAVREFVEKHMKTSEVKILPEVSEYIWKRGAQNPPRSVKVSVEKDEDGVVTVSLAK